ncbi:MAG: hypothetical protein AB1444_16465 [Spirochaetota bacterium]
MDDFIKLYPKITSNEREVIQKMLYAPEKYSIWEITQKIGVHYQHPYENSSGMQYIFTIPGRQLKKAHKRRYETKQNNIKVNASMRYGEKYYCN